MAANAAAHSISNLLASLSNHLQHLRKRKGSECDASTVQHLLHQCGALQSALQLLLQSLDSSPCLQARLTSLLQKLTDATRDLHREGGIAVRSNAEVWSDILSVLEVIVASVSQAVNDWVTKQQTTLHTSLRCLQGTVRHLRDASEELSPSGDARILQEIFLSVVNCTSMSMRLLGWYYVCASNSQVQTLQVWLLQLDSALHLLPPAVATFSPNAIGNQTNCTVGLNVLTDRVLNVVDEIITITAIGSTSAMNEVDSQSDNQTKYQPGAFVGAVDRVLSILFQEGKVDSSSYFSACSDQDHLKGDSINDSVNPLTNASSITLATEHTINNYTNDSCGISSHLEFMKTEYVASKSVLPLKLCSQTNAHVSQLVKEPLENILRHVIAIAYCSSQADNKTIMVLCENVLSSLKRLARVESGSGSTTITTSSSAPDPVDLSLGREILSEAVERLEQAANTALIRCFVTTFAVVDAPLDALLGAVKQSGLEDDYSCDRDGSLGVVEGLIADLDLHVDAIFQVTAFAIACSADASRVNELRSCLLSLEWLEGVLVPSIQTLQAHIAQRSPESAEIVVQERDIKQRNGQRGTLPGVDVKNQLSSNACSIEAAKSHVKLLARHWRTTVASLQSCLDKILEPAAFVMVTQREVHACWWSVKQQLYTQDTRWLRGRVAVLTGMVERLGQLNAVEPFLDQKQEQQLTAGVSEVRHSLSAVERDPVNLRQHRALLKRVQLLLTLVTRLSASLNDTSVQDASHLPLGAHGMRRNLEKARHPPPFVTGGAPNTELNNFFLTSDIATVPVDVGTPFRTTAARTDQQTLSAVSCVFEKQEDVSYYFHEVPRDVLGKRGSKSVLDEVMGDDQSSSGDPSYAMDSSLNKTMLGSCTESSRTGLTPYMELEGERDAPQRRIESEETAVPFSRSVSKLGISRLKTGPASNATPDEYSVCSLGQQRGGEEGGSDDTSIDITKFLTLSFSPCRAQSVRSSIRASLRSALLRSRAGSLRGDTATGEVNGLDVDLNCIIGSSLQSDPHGRCKPSRPPSLPPKAPKPASANEKPLEDGELLLKTCSDLGTDRLQMDCQTSTNDSCVHFEGDVDSVVETSIHVSLPMDESPCFNDSLGSSDVKTLTGILENLSAVAANFSILSNPSSWDPTDVVHEDDDKLLFHPECSTSSEKSSTILRDRASMGDKNRESPRNDVTSTEVSSFQRPDESAATNCPIKKTRVTLNDDNKENALVEPEGNDSIRSNGSEFLSILGKNSSKTSIANLLFHHQTEPVFPTVNRLPLKATNVNTCTPSACVRSDHVLQKSVASSELELSPQTYTASNSMSTGKTCDLAHAAGVDSVVTTYSDGTCLSTPESLSVSTPQRLLDLQVLSSRLANLRSMFKLK